ncbi:hypothetical protein ACFPIJ_57895 [Dactylosporangium cerinum]|uniref:Uncharacterized protein n=1 Tax=Dactylosporangium cerinum TaxID=1434730 RepID=A0ABV9WIX6_9ACTN
MALLCELLETGLVVHEAPALQQAARRGESIADAVLTIAADLGVRLRQASRHVVPPPGPGEWTPFASVYLCPAEPRCGREWLKTAGVTPPHCLVAGLPLRRSDAG